MNCEGFRETCLSDPRCRDLKFLKHRRDCAACAAFSNDINGFDGLLASAARLPVPEGVADRAGRKRKKRPWSLLVQVGVAAGVVAVLVGGTVWGLAPLTPGDAVLAHVHDEVGAMASHETVGQPQVDELLHDYGAHWAGAPSTVLFAETCGVGGATGGHLVLATPEGPVSVILFGESIEPHEFEDDDLVGAMRPGGKGSMAVVVPRGRDLSLAVQHVRRAIVFGGRS